MAFIQDPRMRQRWNQISHTTEAVTENAAAGIWSFGHTYLTPCLSSVSNALDSCTSVCLGGDREERARRARERDRGARRTRAEYSFDFYDDWDDDWDVPADDGVGTSPGGGGGGTGGGGRWREDWDRLLAGTGSRHHRHNRHNSEAGEIGEQPRRKRGMSYGTRGISRKVTGEEDPNVIPRTAPLGFLGRLPFKIVGSLRYKPSAANLQDHPGGGAGSHEHDSGRDYGFGGEGEGEPLLGGTEERRTGNQARQSRHPNSRARSNTVESGDTSSSYRSRGDLFPSDGEGDEDAVPLDDEFTVALDRVDDRRSDRTGGSKGKRVEGAISRSVSRTTIASGDTGDEAKDTGTTAFPMYEETASAEPPPPTMEELQKEEERLQREEEEAVERRRKAAEQLALQRGLSRDDLAAAVAEHGPAEDVGVVKSNGSAGRSDEESGAPPLRSPSPAPVSSPSESDVVTRKKETDDTLPTSEDFVPARLPHFR